MHFPGGHEYITIDGGHGNARLVAMACQPPQTMHEGCCQQMSERCNGKSPRSKIFGVAFDTVYICAGQATIQPRKFLRYYFEYGPSMCQRNIVRTATDHHPTPEAVSGTMPMQLWRVLESRGPLQASCLRLHCF